MNFSRTPRTGETADFTTAVSKRACLDEAERRRNLQETYTESLMVQASDATMVSEFMNVFDKNSSTYEKEFQEEMQDHPDTVGRHYHILVKTERVVTHKSFAQRYFFRCCDIGRIRQDLLHQRVHQQCFSTRVFSNPHERRFLRKSSSSSGVRFREDAFKKGEQRAVREQKSISCVPSADLNGRNIYNNAKSMEQIKTSPKKKDEEVLHRQLDHQRTFIEMRREQIFHQPQHYPKGVLRNKGEHVQTQIGSRFLGRTASLPTTFMRKESDLAHTRKRWDDESQTQTINNTVPLQMPCRKSQKVQQSPQISKFQTPASSAIASDGKMMLQPRRKISWSEDDEASSANSDCDSTNSSSSSSSAETMSNRRHFPQHMPPKRSKSMSNAHLASVAECHGDDDAFLCCKRKSRRRSEVLGGTTPVTSINDRSGSSTSLHHIKTSSPEAGHRHERLKRWNSSADATYFAALKLPKKKDLKPIVPLRSPTRSAHQPKDKIPSVPLRRPASLQEEKFERKKKENTEALIKRLALKSISLANRRRNEVATYMQALLESSTMVQYNRTSLDEYIKNFKLEKLEDELQIALAMYPHSVGHHYGFLVPFKLSAEEFWIRYFWRCSEKEILKELRQQEGLGDQLINATRDKDTLQLATSGCDFDSHSDSISNPSSK